MKLGLSLGYSGPQLQVPLKKVQLAERLGYDSVWTAEAYGSDAITPLAYIAAHTDRIRLGTGVIQLAARTPANAAMCFATLDQLAGGNRARAARLLDLPYKAFLYRLEKHGLAGSET